MEQNLSQCHELRATCVRGWDAFLALEAAWRALLARARPGNPFLSWEWVSEWGHSFWNDDLITVIVHAGSSAVAIAPFFRGPSLPLPGLGAKHLQLHGPRWGRNVFEIGTALVDPTHAQNSLSLAIESLWREEEWDWIEVLAMGDEIETWQRALQQAAVTARTVTETISDVPVMSLGEGWEQLRSRLRRNVKQSIRHAYNSPAVAGVVYQYREHRTVAGLDEVIDDFIRLHRLRANHRTATPHWDVFETPPAELFLRRVCRRMAEAGLLNISICQEGETRVAMRINLEMNGTLYLYYSGFDPGWARYSVMTFTTTQAIKSAIERRLHQVNFSPGVDQAKNRWDVTMLPLARSSIVHDRRRSRARFALYRALRRGSKWRQTVPATVLAWRPGISGREGVSDSSSSRSRSTSPPTTPIGRWPPMP